MPPKRENLLYSTVILTVASLVTRVIGMVFRIYLSNQIGAVGMGLYQMILSVYTFLSTFATSGITIAVSGLVSAHLAKKEIANAKFIIRFCLGLSALLGIITGVILYAFADPIGNFIIKDPAAALSLRILAPGLVFLSLSACFRGYFLAVSKVSKPAVAMILEQFSRMAIIVFLMGIWLPLGLQFACAAAVVGMTVSEFFSAAYLYFCYRRDSARISPQQDDFTIKKRSLVGSIMRMTVPVALSLYLQSTLRLIENILLPNSLRSYAGGSGDGIGLYGTLKGMAMPLLMFPSVFLSSLSAGLIPEISRSVSVRNFGRVDHTLHRVIKITLLCGICVTVLFAAFSHEFGILLYQNETVGQILFLLAPLCPLIYLEIVVSGILRGLGEQISYLKYNIVDSLLRIFLILIVVPNFGLYGFIGIMYLSNVYTSLSAIRRLVKVTGLTFAYKEWIVIPILCGGLTGLFSKGVFRLLLTVNLDLRLALCGAILLICSGYLILLLITKSVTKQEIHWLKKRIWKGDRKPKPIPNSV